MDDSQSNGSDVKNNLLHNGKTPFTYSEGTCYKQFLNSQILNRHLKTHNKKYKCSVCLKLFRDSYELRKHKINGKLKSIINHTLDD